MLPDVSQDTVLDFVGLGIVGASARGIRQSIQPVPNGNAHYDVWGRVVHTGRASLNRFKTSVSGEDHWPPAFGGLWSGRRLTIHCACELPQPQPATMAPIRTPVPGSVIYLDADSNEVSDPTQAMFLNFRPILDVVVVNWSIERAEWEDRVTWSVEFWESGRG